MRESGRSDALPGRERVRARRSGGRRAVKAGEVVLRSTPFAHVIDAPYLSMYCDTCIVHLRDCLLQPCRECRVVWYCSDECQEEALAWHRLECLALKRRQHNLPPDFARLLARVILRLRNGGDKYVEKYSEREGRRFRDLMSHYPDIKKMEDMKQDAEYLRQELGSLIGERLLPNVTDFLGIYGRILVNRFSLFEKTLLNIGSAVYLAASIFDHECSPNCHLAFSGRTVEIRTLIDMPSFDYNKCRIAYVDPVSTVAARRQDLYKKWLFWCDCKTCHDKERRRFENSVICENPECGAPVSLLDTDTHTEAPLLQKAKQESVATNGKEERKKKEKEETSVDQNNTHTEAARLQKARQKDVVRNGKKDKREEKEMEASVDQKRENATKEASLNHKRVDGRKNGAEEEENDDEDEEEDEEDEEEVKYGQCVVCGREVSEERTKTYWDAVAFTREKLRNMTEEEPEMQFCLEMMERQQGILSYLNAWRVRTLDFAFNAAMFRGCWSLALKYAEENQDGMRFYYGPKNPVYGLFLYKLGKAKIYFKEFREGVRILEEAEAILTIALGDSHPLLEDLRLVNLSANEDVEICLERRIAAAKKREEERQKQEQSVPPQGDNFAPHKTFPWFSCENDTITKPLTALSHGIKERGLGRGWNG